MKANELRIGNFICNGLIPDEYYYKVLSIGEDECEFEQIYCEGEESFEWLFKDNYCGIPLTEEWLLNFGFIYDKYLQIYSRDYLGFKKDNLTSVGLFYGINWIDCKYVHQLQNLYFPLTGEELELK